MPNESLLPLIHGIAAKTMGLDLVSVQPMLTHEEMAKGRPIAKFPTRFDSFRTEADLEEHVRMRIREGALDPSHLSIGLVVTLPFNLPTSPIYYTPGPAPLVVSCPDPGHHGCCKRTVTICELDPEVWEPSIRIIISRIQGESQNDASSDG